MLLAAVADDSDSVFVDLLTYADLEALKTKRAGGASAAAHASSKGSSKTNNKRYLILTYAAEFDRVHYPLPLLHEDTPSPEAFKATIARLTRENAQLSAKLSTEGHRGGAGGGAGGRATYGEGGKMAAENIRLTEDNEALRAQVRQLQRQLASAEKAAADGGGGWSAKDSGCGSVRDAAAYEQVEHLQAEVKAMGKEMRALRRERDDLSRALHAKETELANVDSSKKRMLSRKQKEVDAAVTEANRRKDTERELRIRVKDLSTEVEGLQRRLRVAQSTGAGSRGVSPARGAGTFGGGPSRYGTRSSTPSNAGSRSRAGSVERDRVRPWATGRSRSPSPGPSSGRSARLTTSTDPPRGRSPSPARRAASPRFDPTAYVRQKQERDAERYRNSARGIASGANSPNASLGSRDALRAAAARGKTGGVGGGGGRYGGYSSAQSSRGGTPTAASPARPVRGPSAPRARSPSPTAERTRTGSGVPSPKVRPGPAEGPRVGADRDEVASITAQHSKLTAGPGLAAQRNGAVSPGRILRDVKQKLADFASKENDVAGARKSASPAKEFNTGGSGGTGAGVGASKPPLAKAIYSDASAEIADIDSRLLALQNFLRDAKGTA